MKKYQVTKKQCQDKINQLGNVCSYCGRKLIPINTTDNSGNPTYWIGCCHGNNSNEAFGHFTNGVKKEVFDIAEKLVCNGEVCYRHIDRAEKLYWFQSQVNGFCSMISNIEYLKNNNARMSKDEFLNKMPLIIFN